MSTESGPQVEVSSVLPFPSILEDKRNASLHISGGNFNNVEGNSYTFHAGCHVYLADQRYISGMPPIASGSAHSHGPVTTERLDNRPHGFSALNKPIGALPPREPLDTSPQQSLEEHALSVEFVIAKSNLRSIKQLVIPHADQEGIFKRIVPFLADLETIISFASTAYDACHGATAMGKVIRANIEDRMTRCNTTLEELHDELGRLPYRSLPRRVQSYAYRVVYEWWTGNEPEEIVAIRTRISDEVIAIGQWLRCLHSFWWASSQLLLAKSTFNMGALKNFLSSGPVTMLQTITVEEIFFLEPLQGARRSIPVRFVKAFEDVHMAVELACRGTAASRFIDGGQYQLDDPFTDTSVGSEEILHHIRKCKEYEITIVLSKLEVSPNECPKCGLHHDDNEPTLTGWLTCRYCGTKFNSRLPAAVPVKGVVEQDMRTKRIPLSNRGVSLQADDRIEERAMDQKRSFSGPTLGGVDEVRFAQGSLSQSSAFRGLGSTDTNMAKLFRRIRFEIESNKGILTSGTPESSTRRPRSFDNLPTTLELRHKQTSSIDSVVESVVLLREELLLRPAGHPLRLSSLNKLANSLESDFDFAGNAESLDEAIVLHREALILVSPGHPDHPQFLNKLTNSLFTRFEFTGTPEDLYEAIALNRQVLSLLPPGHPDLVSGLNALANSLLSDFRVTGSTDSLDEAISLYRAALALAPPGHLYREMGLRNLADALLSHFDLTGTIQSLDEAIALNRQVLSLLPPGHPDLVSGLNALANSLLSDFRVTGSADSLDEAISLYRAALMLVPLGHPSHASCLGNLADSLLLHHNMAGAIETLEEAIILHREALSLRPPGHPDRASCLGNLANSLSLHHNMAGAIETLDEAIILYREALSLRPPGHPDRASSLGNLADSLSSHYSMTGTVKSLDGAIVLYREALSLVSPGHPNHASGLRRLAECLSSHARLTSIVGPAELQ
ncbi:hypothetical protein BKA70DRAFT_137597 [Coprinopsis sp. MPI-PUGE-AT-0042]|nr:hypothetical protein BKA70DRAFT_137597 [Coprinopsis sp. MPI-PUGE-AT-0042]